MAKQKKAKKEQAPKKEPLKSQIINVKGDIIDVAPKDGEKFTDTEVSEIIGGTPQEFLAKDGRLILMDKIGRQIGKGYNRLATKIYRDRLKEGAIVGDVLVCEKKMLAFDPAAKPEEEQ